jgi:hypothetical protein
MEAHRKRNRKQWCAENRNSLSSDSYSQVRLQWRCKVCALFFFCVYVYTCMCVYVYTYTYIHAYIHKGMHTYIYTYIHTYVHGTYINTYIHIYTDMHACCGYVLSYIYAAFYLSACMCMHVYTQRPCERTQVQECTHSHEAIDVCASSTSRFSFLSHSSTTVYTHDLA